MANSVKTTSDWMSLFLGSSRSGQDRMTVSGLSGSEHLCHHPPFAGFMEKLSVITWLLRSKFRQLLWLDGNSFELLLVRISISPFAPRILLTAHLRRVERRGRVQREQVLQLRPRGRRVPRTRAVLQVTCDWWRPGHVIPVYSSPIGQLPLQLRHLRGPVQRRDLADPRAAELRGAGLLLALHPLLLPRPLQVSCDWRRQCSPLIGPRTAATTAMTRTRTRPGDTGDTATEPRLTIRRGGGRENRVL